MTRSARRWAGLFLAVALLTLAGPFFAADLGDPLRSEALAFARGGPLGLGYDYIGRPIAPQLLLGGRSLLLAALGTAVLSRALSLALGLYLAAAPHGAKGTRFLLDTILVLPSAVVSLAIYQAFQGSVYAVVPAICLMILPFASRYYARLATPILQSEYFLYARLRARSFPRTVVRETLPLLAKNLWTDLSQTFISAIYALSSVVFLGRGTLAEPFLWPQMVAANFSGVSLNPWACLAPLVAILLLTVPLGNAVDAMERSAHD